MENVAEKAAINNATVLDELLFKKAGIRSTAQVVRADSGQLFLAGGHHEPFLTKMGVLPVDEQKIELFRSNHSFRKGYCDGRRITWKTVIAPDKESALWHHLPKSIELSSIIDKFATGLDDIVDLREATADDSSWLTTDTHWSQRGRFNAVNAIARAMGIPDGEVASATQIFRASIATTTSEFCGDLGSRFTPRITEQIVDVATPWIRSEATNNNPMQWNDGVTEIVSSKIQNGRRLLVFGDSFSKHSLRHFALYFSEIVFCRTRFFHEEMVDMFRPTHVVSQMLERYLPTTEPDEVAPRFLLIPFLREVETKPTPTFWADLNKALTYRASAPKEMKKPMTMNTRNVFGLSMVPGPGLSTAIRNRQKDSRSLPSSSYLFPPPDLMQYGESAEAHAESGKREYDSLMDVVRTCNVSLERTLDFACSNGRVTRWFEHESKASEVWGVDIDARRIAWALATFGGKFHFAAVTTAPNLPFADSYFDFIYAFSIFTHLDDTWTAWVQELRRIVVRGGHVLITLNDEGKGCLARNDMVGKILREHPDFAAFMHDDGMYSYHVNSNGVLFTAISSKVFRKVVDPFFSVVDVREMMGGQTAYTLKREL